MAREGGFRDLNVNLDDKIIGVVGLGYVGLPLAAEFGKSRPGVGFDIREKRVAEFRSGADSTLEVDPGELKKACFLEFTSRPVDFGSCGVFIVAVATPVDRANRPDLHLLERACETVGLVMPKGSVVVFEFDGVPRLHAANLCAHP